MEAGGRGSVILALAPSLHPFSFHPPPSVLLAPRSKEKNSIKTRSLTPASEAPTESLRRAKPPTQPVARRATRGRAAGVL